MSQDLQKNDLAISISDNLAAADKALIEGFLSQLPTDHLAEVAEVTINPSTPILISQWVDGRGLPCPMPLLKTKVALRRVQPNEALYTIATDPNSQADIRAFCQQSPELTLIWAQKSQPVTASDTIFHFIITKTDSN